MTKKSKEGITFKKEENFSEWYSEIVQKADLADIRFGIQGFIVHKPWGFLILRKIYEYLEKEVESQNHLPFLFPIAVKEKNLKKEKEHAGFTPEVFWVSEAGDKKIEERFALRGREFMFFETHDVFNTHEEAKQQIEDDLDTCKKVIYDKIKIPFYYFKRPTWDKFKGADETFTPDTLMPDGKRNQLASTHDLGHNFAKAYDIKVVGKDGKENYVWQTCFGPGIWKIMAALIGIHGDDKGLILPFDMAPLQIVIIPITFGKKDDKLMKKAKEMESKIKKEGYKVKMDERDESPGFKYHHWELLGVPLRIELGQNEMKGNSLTLSLRTEDKKRKIKNKELMSSIKKLSLKLDKDIKNKADDYFKNNTKNAYSIKDLKSLIEKNKGFVKVPFCSVDKDGEKCADILKFETEGGSVCGTLYPKEEKVTSNQRCIVCNKKANHIVYVAKSY